MPPSADIWFLVVSNSTDGMGPCSVIWMYSAVNLRKKLYVTPARDWAMFASIDTPTTLTSSYYFLPQEYPTVNVSSSTFASRIAW